nr:peptidyl-prolyl cis-trans isomerase E-like isoform X1 [Lytechinus pictus]
MDIQIPLDYETEKHRGFAFVEFEFAEDCAAAIDNMNDSELFGRTIRVNLAKPMKIKDGSAKAVWSDDTWLKKYAGATLKKEEGGVVGGDDDDATATKRSAENAGETAEPPSKKTKANPQVFFDIKIGSKAAGRITVQLKS